MNLFDIIFAGTGLIMGWGLSRFIPTTRPRLLLVTVWIIAAVLGSLMPF